MSGPDHDKRARCLARSRFSSPAAQRRAGAARRRAGAAPHGPTGPGPPGTRSPRARPAALSTGSPRLPGPATAAARGW